MRSPGPWKRWLIRMVVKAIRDLVASDGYAMACLAWSPAGPPTAHVVALHGIQSHAGWYEYSSRRLAEAGCEVLFLDRRGSGANRDRRGDAVHADRLVNDVAGVLADVRHRRDRDTPGSPVVLLSVSWGGKLAAVTAARRPELVDGLALLYPGIKARVRAGWVDRLRLEVAGRLGLVDRLVDLPLRDEWFTASPDWLRFIGDDPLTLRQVTVAFMLANRQLDREAAAAPVAVACPVLMMLAGYDRIIDNEATRHLFVRFDSSRRLLIEYPEAEHTLEFEADRDRFIDDLIDWIGGVRPSIVVQDG